MTHIDLHGRSSDTVFLAIAALTALYARTKIVFFRTLVETGALNNIRSLNANLEYDEDMIAEDDLVMFSNILFNCFLRMPQTRVPVTVKPEELLKVACWLAGIQIRSLSCHSLATGNKSHEYTIGLATGDIEIIADYLDEMHSLHTLWAVSAEYFEQILDIVDKRDFPFATIEEQLENCTRIFSTLTKRSYESSAVLGKIVREGVVVAQDTLVKALVSGRPEAVSEDEYHREVLTALADPCDRVYETMFACIES